MSKIGKQPITIPEKTTVTVEGREIKIKGPKGELVVPQLEGIAVNVEDGKTITFTAEGEDKQSRSNWGTLRALVANAIAGVENGFEKTLIIEGVGYKVDQKGKGIALSLGFSHVIEFEPPDNITLAVQKDSSIKISGIDKAVVGEVAAKIRAIKKPEPYKGKGIRYHDEVIKRKVGKKAATTAA